MHKSSLQNLCQLRQWKLPEYTSAKNGPDHNPSFTAIVNVNGTNFSANGFCRKAKEAENSAAKVAFDYFTGATPPVVNVASPLAPPPQFPSSGLCIGGPSTPTLGSSLTVGDNKKFTDAVYLYKNRLQNYALKHNLKLPAYSTEREGPAHAPRFRTKVTFQETTFESSEFYPTVKEAENAAAKRAWESCSLDEAQQDDTALYKNLLQEFLQKKGCSVPKYEITSSGPPHMPAYVAKVDVQGEVYEGEAGFSKKQAESYAAKVAYWRLIDQQNEARERNVYSEQHANREPVLASGSSIKEALNISSSILQSLIAGEGSPKPTPNSNHLVPVKLEVGSEASNGHVPPPVEAENNAKRLCLPTSDQVNGVNNAQVGSDDTKWMSKETIMVCPRVPNMTCPEGIVLPLSDDKWVAVRILSNQ